MVDNTDTMPLEQYASCPKGEAQTDAGAVSAVVGIAFLAGARFALEIGFACIEDDVSELKIIVGSIKTRELARQISNGDAHGNDATADSVTTVTDGGSCSMMRAEAA